MSKIVLPTITNGQDLTNINSNFSKIASALNDDVLYRDNPVGEANQLNNDIDANGHNLFNVDTISAEEVTLNGQSIADTVNTALSTIAADVVIVNAQANSATNSAANAATSASNAAATLANALIKSNNLSDLTSVATAKTNLALVKGDVGLGNVDNTSDVNKPVSTAQAAADALKLAITTAATTYKTIAGLTTAPGAGVVGEELTATGTSTGLTNNIPITLATLLLTPGVWEVSSVIDYIPAATTVMQTAWAGTNTVTNTMSALGSYQRMNTFGSVAGQGATVVSPVKRYVVTTNTNVFAIGQSFFNTSTETATGYIRAVRV